MHTKDNRKLSSLTFSFDREFSKKAFRLFALTSFERASFDVPRLRFKAKECTKVVDGLAEG
jgi:hypothetical protein